MSLENKEVVEAVEPVVEVSAPVEQAPEKEANPLPPGKEPAPKEGEEEPLPPAAQAYKAREKFKVMVYGSDEQKEHDVPDLLKPLMKDAATEKEVIELLEKAYGLEPVKASRTAVAKERDHFKGEFSKVQQTISDVRQTYQRGDIDAFLHKLAIPQERMLQWALEKVNYSQLPPDQQSVLDARQEAERRAWAAEQQTMTMEQQIQEQSRQAKQVMLQASLSRPDVQSFASSYDSQAGKAGAFFEEVRTTGEYAWVQSQGKVDLTPDQAIEQVMKKWGAFVKPAAPVAQGPAVPPTAAQAASQAGAGTSAAKPAVIPNLQGRSNSPLKAGPRSLDDLRKLQKNMST